MDVIDYLKSLSGYEAEHECWRHLTHALTQLQYAAIAAESTGYGAHWKHTLRTAIDATQEALDQLQ